MSTGTSPLGKLALFGGTGFATFPNITSLTGGLVNHVIQVQDVKAGDRHVAGRWTAYGDAHPNIMGATQVPTPPYTFTQVITRSWDDNSIRTRLWDDPTMTIVVQR
jgi:hypothetical protein